MLQLYVETCLSMSRRYLRQVEVKALFYDRQETHRLIDGILVCYL